MPAPRGELDYDAVDEWAVDIVVKEHVRMNLNHTEQIVAAIRLKRQGCNDEKIADILRVTVGDVEAMIRRGYRNSVLGRIKDAANQRQSVS